MIVIDIIVLIINLFVFIYCLDNVQKRLSIYLVVLLVFQIVYVLPIVIELFFGTPNFDYKFPIYQLAIDDKLINFYYAIFCSLVPIALIFMDKKNKTDYDLKESISKFKISRELFILMYILMFLPCFMILFSPSPDKYLFHYAYFQINGKLSSVSELSYHRGAMKISGVISLISIMTVRFFGKSDKTNTFFIYLAAILTGILNGKRTLFAMIFLVILIVDILKAPRGKFPVRKSIITLLSLVLIFVGYAYLIDKHTKNFSTFDDLRLYFFRDFDVKIAMYCLVYPDRFTMLDYIGQSYMYNLLFFIPRTLWESKPYPYDIYVTSVALGRSYVSVLPWSVQTSNFGEALSNFGILGIPLLLLILDIFIKISENTKNSLVIILCLFISVFSFMNHYGSFKWFVLLWLSLVIISKFKKRKG